jgi:signal peptidase I
MDNDKKEPADLSARLGEEELPKPGEIIKPGQDNTKPETTTTITTTHTETANNSINKDIDEFNKFVVAQQEDTIEEEKPSKGALHVVWEIGKTILIAAAVVFFINTFVFQAYYVSGNSMNPNYHDGDYLLISKFPTSMRNIAGIFGQKGNLNLKRGDILVFRPPEAPNLFYIKRVIALPGERLTLKDGVFTIYNKDNPNGMVLKEPYIDPRYKTEGEVDEVIAPGHVFMVGDNRSPGGSYDSRAWGQLNQDAIIGNAFFRLIPLNNIGFIVPIDYSSN